MKITSFALATAFSMIAGGPSLVSAGTSYNCKVDASYDTDYSTQPNQEEKDWAATKLRSAYRDVHDSGAGGDFDMTSYSVTDFDLTPTRMAHYKGDRKKLRGENGVKYNSYYRGTIIGTGGVYCDFCNNWDDDGWMMDEQGADGAVTNMVAKMMDFGQVVKKNENHNSVVVGATATHDRWVAAFCDDLYQGPYEVYWDIEYYLDSCTITLYDCVEVTEGDENAVAVGADSV